MHMVSRKDLNSAFIGKRKGFEKSDERRCANKRRGNSVCQRIGFLFVTVMLLEDTLAVLSLGKLCENHGNNYHWTSGQKPHLIKHGRKINCNTANCVPFVVPGLPTSSSTSSSPTFLTSSSQETLTHTEHPAATNSESTNEEKQRNLSHGPAEAEKPFKNDDNVDVQGNLSHDLPEWPQEFRHGLLNECVPEHRDASSPSHESPSEPRAKVVSGKHSILTHFPKDRN